MAKAKKVKPKMKADKKPLAMGLGMNALGGMPPAPRMTAPRPKTKRAKKPKRGM